MADSAKTIATEVSPYLKQVRIRDYPPLRDAKVDFKPGLNIIIGKNGAGKTRFLSLSSQLVAPFAIHSVGVGCEVVLKYDQDLLITFQQPAALEEARHIRTIGDSILVVHAAYGNKQGIGEDLYEALMRVDLEENLPETVLAQHGVPLQKMILSDIPASIVYGVSFKAQIESVDNISFFQNQPLLVSSIFNTLRYLFSRRRRYNKINSITTPFSVEEARADITRVIGGYLNFLNPYLVQYSPIAQVRLSNTFQVYDNTAQQEILVKGLVLEYLVAESWLPFAALSDGTKRILYFISQLVTPSSTFDTAKSQSSFEFFIPSRIIFLEEPELGIHHSQLHKLLQLIREVSSGSQIIMTTHAPQVLDMLGADELDRITICSLDPKKGTQFHKLTEEKQEQARVYMKEVGFLSDYWRYSYLEETEAD